MEASRTHGKFRSARILGIGARAIVWRLIPWVLMAALAAAVIAALAMTVQTRAELTQLKVEMEGLEVEFPTLPPLPEGENGENPDLARILAQHNRALAQLGEDLTELREDLASLRPGLAESNQAAKEADVRLKELARSAAAATRERDELRLSMIRVLGRVGGPEAEISQLLESLSKEQQKRIKAELAPPAAGTGNPENSKTPPPAEPGDDDPNDEPENEEDPPLPEHNGGSALDGNGPGVLPPPPPGSGRPAREYVVKKGDNLSGIAKQHKVSQQAILEANKSQHPRLYRNPDRIFVGMKLKIPREEK